MIDPILKRNQEMVALLSEVIMDSEEYSGRISPPTYLKIKQFFEEDIPEDWKERVKEWEEYHGKTT